MRTLSGCFVSAATAASIPPAAPARARFSGLLVVSDTSAQQPAAQAFDSSTIEHQLNIATPAPSSLRRTQAFDSNTLEHQLNIAKHSRT